MSDNKTELALNSFKTREEFETLLQSGAIPSSLNSPEKLATVIQTGKELGMPPMVSINNINVIKGRTVISASMMGAMLKRNNIEWVWTKDFVVEGDNKFTELEFEWISKVTGKPKTAKFCVSWNQMVLANYTTKDNWKTLPKQMMRARCITEAIRAYFPEILLGFYTDLEIVESMSDEDASKFTTILEDDGNIKVVPNDNVDDAQIVE